MKNLVEFWLVASDQQKKGILITLTDQQLKFLTEIMYNVAADNIPIADEHKKKLSKHKLSFTKC